MTSQQAAMNCAVLSLAAGNKGRCLPTTPLGRLERELEIQVKESFQESQALQERYQKDLLFVREDAERRVAERNRHTKRQQVKLKERISCAERHMDDALQQATLLQEQLFVSSGEVRVARSRVFELESEVQQLRSQPPQVVERAAPGMIAETTRLRDRAAAMEEQAKRAQRAASEAREAVGRESAINQGFQSDVDNARHRLLTVQGSLAEAVEENTGLRRELEAERIKVAAGSRRLADAVERQEAALAQVRSELSQLRDQRDSLAQDCAVLSIKLRHLKKTQAARRILHILRRDRYAGLSKGLRAWVVWLTNDIQAKKLTRQQDEHNSEIQSLEEDLRNAEGRFIAARQRCEAIRDSRETVAGLVVTASRRRRGMAAAAEERGAPALQWCFWGWARVTRGGDAAVTTRTKMIDAERELPGLKERLREVSEKATCAENDFDQQRETVARMQEEINQGKSDLESANASLNTMQNQTTAIRDRSIQHGTARVHAILGRHRREQVAEVFAWWVQAISSRPQEKKLVRSTVSSQTDGTVSKQSRARTESRSRETEVPVKKEDVEASSMQAGGGIESPAYTTKEAAASVLITSDDDNRTGRLCSATHDPEHASPSMTAARDFVTADQDIAVPGANCCTVAESSSDTQASNTATISASRAPTGRPGTAKNPWVFDAPLNRVRVVAAHGIAATGLAATRVDILEGDNAYGDSSASGTHAETSVPTKEDLFLGVENQPLPDSGRSDSVCSSVPTHVYSPLDLPRLLLALRTAVGNQLYTIGERLLRCVEADHREIHAKPYRPIALTGAERDQFRACLEDSVRGPLRSGVMAFLRAQESYRAIAVERDRSKKRTVQICSDGGGCTGVGGSDSLRRAAKTIRGKTKGALQIDKRDCDISTLTTGPLSSPAQKARAARVLRDRLVVLLENADDAWATHRQPWRNAGAGTSPTEAKGRLRRARTLNSGTRHLPNGNNEQGFSSSSRLACLDSGAGPRKFWKAVAGPKFVDASWNIDIEFLEQQLWELAILVREQDRGQRLALGRCESLRRMLDLRVYEILLLHVRTRIIWDGAVNDDTPVTRDGETSSMTEHGRDRRDRGRKGFLGSAVMEVERAIAESAHPKHNNLSK